MPAGKSLRLFRHALSGHSHRVELALSLFGLPYELVDVDLARGAQRSEEFLARSPFGQVPVLEDDEVVLFDSNAILVYLAERHDLKGLWWPRDAVRRAGVQAWLSVAAGQVAYGPALARLVTVFGASHDSDAAIARAHALLQVMDTRLGTQAFLAGETPTLADIACYSYVAAAPEGNVDLAKYDHVRGWLARIEALEGFVPFQRSRVGLAA